MQKKKTHAFLLLYLTNYLSYYYCSSKFVFVSIGCKYSIDIFAVPLCMHSFEFMALCCRDACKKKNKHFPFFRRIGFIAVCVQWTVVHTVSHNFREFQMANKQKNDDRNFIGNAGHAETIVCPIHLAGKHLLKTPISDVLISNHFACAYQCGSHMSVQTNESRFFLWFYFYFLIFFFFLFNTFIWCGCAFIVSCMVCVNMR